MSKWENISLDKLCNFDKGKTGLAKAIEGEFPLITTGADRKTCNEFQFNTKAVCIPLVSSTGHGHASINYIHYQEGKFALGTILVALTAKNESIINMKFLHLYLSELKDIILVPLMTGAANVSLSISKIKKVEIPLPPIEEQNRIVKLFESIVEEQQVLETEISNQQNLLTKLKQSILQEAIEGKLTSKWREQNQDFEPASVLLEKIQAEKEQLIKDKKIKKSKPLPEISEDEIPFELPDNWEWCRVSELGVIYNGNSINKAEKEIKYNKKIDGYSYIATKDVDFNTNTLDYENGIYIPYEETSFKTAKKDTTLICAEGGSVGKKIGYVERDICFGNKLYAIDYYSINVPKYLFYLYKSDFFYKQIKNLVGGIIGGISIANFNSLFIPLPSITEQKEIVKQIEKLFAICDELEEQINSSKQNTQTLMQAILNEAFATA